MNATITDTQADPKAPQTGRYVFVYGTLRGGEERDINRLSPAPIFIGNSQIKGTLYQLGSYPGLRLGGEQAVQGEVYQITLGLERQLDVIESVLPQPTGEYERREVVVQCTGLELACLVYEASAQAVLGKALIVSGDWLQRGDVV